MLIGLLGTIALKLDKFNEFQILMFSIIFGMTVAIDKTRVFKK